MQKNTRDPKKMSSYFWYEAPILVIVTISGLIYNDEMTASLDKETEAKVPKAIGATSSGRTVLSISHRSGAHDGRIIKL